MQRKFHWGIAALIIVLIAAGGFMYWQWSSVQQLKEQLAQDDKLLEEKKKPVAKNNLPPAEPGKKWVPHGDHFHQVPIDAPDTGQEAPHGPLTQVSHQTLQQHEPVRTPPEQTEDVVMWDGRKWSEYSPEEKEAAKQQNKLKIWVTYKSIQRSKEQVNDAVPDLSLPITEERYRVMTENPFPYTPEVRSQLNSIVDRLHDAQVEEARLWKEWDKKNEAYWNEKLKRNAQSGELDD